LEIREGRFKVLIKPNSSKNDILVFDKDKNAYIISVKEKAEKTEIIRILSKFTGKRAII